MSPSGIILRENAEAILVSGRGMLGIPISEADSRRITDVKESTMDDFLTVAKKTGIEIIDDDGVIAWTGKYGGNIKPNGPLTRKKVACIAATEFSDFEAYYVASYIGEFGGYLDFLLVDWVTWKYTRPNIKTKGVVGMWGVTVDPIPVMAGNKACNSRSLRDAKAEDYDAVIILGGHAGDMMSTEPDVLDFLKTANKNGAVVGAIGGGIIPLIAADLMNGRKCTGNVQVEFVLEKIGIVENSSCVVDEKIVTARETINVPEFIRAVCRELDPSFKDEKKGILKGKKMLLIAGWDFEDFEIAVPFLELYYRGAEIVIGTFQGSVKSKPPLLGLDVIQGNFGMSIPLQDIDETFYTIKDLNDIKLNEFDALFIPGAFCPWNMIAVGTPIQFLKLADERKKIISFMCHGPWAVAAAGIIQGKRMTGWISGNDAVRVMGGKMVSEWAAAIDQNLVSGKTPQEIPEMLDAITYALLNRE